VVLQLTPGGRELHVRLLALVAARNRRIAGCLRPDERRAFSDMLDRLVRAAAEGGADDGDG
jgi:DNA-binding MarR family transcriptional regulator